ncbi:hypothetical protein DL96DRAFT_1702034 [Flagelloscypha sp. PMI_526]|nr:hypothetical protein DL96DRAFT_1702034 [Flagelloscypha sp. PMI_526]
MTEPYSSVEGKPRYERRISNNGDWTVNPDGSRHWIQPAAETSRPQVSGLPERPSRRPRSKSVHESSTSKDDGHRHSRYRRPVAPPTGSPTPIIHSQNYPRTPLDSSERPSNPARRSHSHSRSQCHQVVHPLDPSVSSVPIIPLQWRQQRPAPVPSVPPPGFPEGTIWVPCSDGWPRLKEPGIRPNQHDTASSAVMLTGPQRDARAHASQSQAYPITDNPHSQTAAIQGESTHFSRASSIRTYDRPRRSRSHSRSRPGQGAPLQDPDAPPVPPTPSRLNHPQKPLPIPGALPPGYPEDSRWVVDFGGRPRTPHQYQERYGVQPPTVAPVRTVFPQHISQHAASPQPPFIQQTRPDSTQPPIEAPTLPPKPFFKKIFGGIIRSNKGTKAPGPAPTGTHAFTNSQQSSRTKPRSRTKSM